MPKIVVDGYVADGAGANKAQHEDANKTKLQEWFKTSSNWEKLAEQLTKKLGASKFKNVVLTAPTVSYEDDESNTRIPKVTFTLRGKDGYTLQTDNGASQSLTLSIRVLYTTENQTENALKYQGASASASAVPNNTTTVNDENVSRTVNVYLNYTGPAIVLDQVVPAVGTAANTLINGTSNVDGAFNTAFRGKLSKGLLFTNRYANPLLKSVINYVNKFDPKYRAEFVTNSINGVTITKVQNTKELRPGTLDDLDKDNVFLQQIQGDTEAVYFAVTAIASNNWLNTVLVRIPLTKFVRPLTEFQDQSATAPTQEGQTTQGQENSAGSGALGSTTGAQTPSGGSSQASGS
ncbi:hemagglutinin [Mycoplasmopsis synoviae]|nr:hemagglutinin [Mycoplasmopsis synoviae]UBX97227.1 hemagglutinin [Mycoplasmopsis synoviae]UBX98437.1 hemagglutinin [Mycoplasmopsis synoviae]UBX98861.1 hemagglutinin [Mycoplasmopsis synoviae]